MTIEKANATARNGLLMVRAQDEAYESARVDRVFNLRRPNHQPEAIVFPTSEEEIVEAVRYANQHELRITIRSGGHSWAAWSVQPGCLLIDLSKFTLLQLDTSAKLITASTCTTGQVLNAHLLKHGLMFGGGHCPDVAIGGFLLQGGQGWGCRTWGWACEQIERMRIVMADGQVITASREQHADVFWAARGAGPGFFGVVISFTLRLRDAIGMWGSTFIFDTLPCYDTVAPWYLQRCEDARQGDLELVMIGCNSNKCMPQLQPNRPVMIVRAVVFAHTEEEARRALLDFSDGMPMRNSPHCHVQFDCQPTSIGQEYAQQALDNPRGHYWTQNAWLEGNATDTATALKRAWTDLPTDQTFALHYSMAPLRPLPTDMCFDLQTAHTFSVYCIALNEASLEIKQSCQAYMEAVFEHGVDRLKPGQGGTAGIYLGDSDLRTRPIRFLSDANWARWKTIRQAWDPSRRFFGFDGESLHGKRWNRNPQEV